eukprot:258703-Chlamydomonas_euryale.AAC.1
MGDRHGPLTLLNAGRRPMGPGRPPMPHACGRGRAPLARACAAHGAARARGAARVRAVAGGAAEPSARLR